MILVTGSAGFIGSCLVNYLINDYKVTGIDDFSTGHKKNVIKHNNYKFINGNCGDSQILKKLKNIKIIIHLAGQSSGERSFENPHIDFVKNTQNTINLLNFAVKIKCNQFIYASSMSVYGDRYKIKVKEQFQAHPISFYGISKECSEKFIIKYKDKGLNYNILRFFNVYGSKQKLGDLKQGMIRIYLTQIFKNKFLEIKGSRERYRDFVHINDVLKIIGKIINNKKYYNEILNIGTGKKTSIDKLIRLIEKKINFKFKIKYTKGTKDDQFGVVADVSKLQKYTKLKKFISINKGLDEMIKNIS